MPSSETLELSVNVFPLMIALYEDGARFLVFRCVLDRVSGRRSPTQAGCNFLLVVSNRFLT